MASTYAEQLTEARRELGLRRYVYAQKEAARHLELQEDIVATLEGLAQEEANQLPLFGKDNAC